VDFPPPGTVGRAAASAVSPDPVVLDASPSEVAASVLAALGES